MIAAGSLFTSCVENTEPQGIKDLREAKADYLASLSKLREADAEKVKAEAAVEQAKAEVQKAIAAQNQALAEAQQIANEIQKARNEKEVEELKAQIDSIKAKAEQDAVAAQKILAERQAALEKALRKIAAEAIGLTEDEKLAITEKTVALNGAYDTYNAWLDAYNGAVKELWEAEYAVAAGKESYETADSYRDSIADVQAQIAGLEADIASYEALKAEPAGIKDTLDAIAEEITALDAEITTKGDVRKLYEASSFVEARKAYIGKWEAFKKDSLSGFDDEFKFVDEEGENRVYEMNSIFNDKVNFVDRVVCYSTYIPDTENPGWVYGNPYVHVDMKGDVIEGKSSFSFRYSSEEEVSKALYGCEEKIDDVEIDYIGLKGIVSALKRDLVIVNNPDDSAIVAEKAKAAHDADSTYKADREILEIGFEKSKFAKKVTDSLAKLAADTVAAKAEKEAGEAELKTKQGDETSKKNAQIVAVRTAAAAYETAVKAMATAVVDFNGEEIDSTAFIKAIQDFGKAQAAFLGEQDSLSYDIHDPYTAGKTTTYKDAFSAVNPSYFKEGTGHPVYKEKFLDVVKTVFGGDASFTTTKKNLIAGLVKNPLKEKTTGTDSINVLKEKNQAVKAAVAAYTAAETARKAIEEKVNDTLVPAFTEAVNAYITYKASGNNEAKAEYTEVYNKFWGYAEGTAQEGIFDPYKFPWTDKTFEEPFTCVVFVDDGIQSDPTFEVIIRGLDNNANTWADPDKYYIFRNQVTLTLTEYANKLKTAQEYDIAKNYTEYEDQLANIEAAVNKAEADFKAYCEEYNENLEAFDEVLARLCGVDKDGEHLEIVEDLEDAEIVDGKWALGGYQLAWAEELAPEYPAIVKDAEEAVRPLKHRKANLVNFKKTLDQVYTAWWNEFEKEGKGYQHSVAAIVKFFENKIDDLNDQIDVLNGDIARYEEIIDACEAGYSPAEAKVAPLKKKVEAYKKYLAQAEEALARAQKEYDEVIAKYGVNE